MLHHISGISALHINVRDLPAAISVFRRLGFTVRQQAHGADIVFGSDRLRLEQGAADRLAGIDFACSDLAGSVESLAKAGLTVDSLPGLPARLVQFTQDEPSDQANGVSGIASITALLTDPEQAIPAYDRLFGLFAATPTDAMVTVHGGGPLLFLVDPDGFDHLHANLTSVLPPPPAPAALALTVGNLDQTEALLKANGLSPRRSGPTLSLLPKDCLGLGIEFVL